MENQPEIMYQSKGTTPKGDPFMSVKKARGYYEYAERGGQDSIAFILFDKDTNKFALINESKPPMDERRNEKVQMTTAFGGSVDMDISYSGICQVEVEEEAGYEVGIPRIHNIGQTLVSSQMSQLCHGFLVDVTGLEKTKLTEFETDPSDAQKAKDATEFSGNSVKWLTYFEVLENNDWKSIWIINRYKFLFR